MKTRTITLSELHRDPKNARKHNPRNIGMITKSIEDVGVGRSGVVDENGIILAGNGTFEALADRGISVVHEIETDGHEWVVVKRPGLSEEQKRKLALADNRASDLATWDGEMLKAQGTDLQPYFTEDELIKIVPASSFDMTSISLGDDNEKKDGESVGYETRIAILVPPEDYEHARKEILALLEQNPNWDVRFPK